MDKSLFKKKLGNNLKSNILKKFKTQKEFADFFDLKTSAVSSWVKGEAQPDIYTIDTICKSMGITIDYLIKGEPEGVTQTSIDYNVFDEVVKLTDAFAKENNIKLGGRQYLAVYESITNLRRINAKLKTKEVFEMLRPTLESWKK